MKPATFYFTTFLFLTLFGCENCASASSSARDGLMYCYQPCVVALHGTAKTTWTYGPPNFGNPKTDKKVAIHVLVLDHKISIRRSNLFDSKKGVSEVQLFFPIGMAPIADKQQVTLIGKLQQATTATDIYPVVMQVSRSKH
jgi:hypothetical protein